MLPITLSRSQGSGKRLADPDIPTVELSRAAMRPFEVAFHLVPHSQCPATNLSVSPAKSTTRDQCRRETRFQARK